MFDADEPGDCYVRVTGGRLRDWERDRVGPAALAFVDIAADNSRFDDLQASMRAIPAGALVGAKWVLVRVPDELRYLNAPEGMPTELGSIAGTEATDEVLSALARQLQDRLVEQGLQLAPTVGLVRFPIGAGPLVGWSEPLPDGIDTARLLQRARRAEAEL